MAEARLAAIVRSSDDAIISEDLSGTIVSWNPAAERLFGYTAAEIIGQSILRLVPDHLRAEDDEILAKIRTGVHVDHYETLRRRRDGTLVEVSISVSPVFDTDGRIIGASKIARDISPERDAQRKKDAFLAILAHELRNPLAPIRTALHLIATRQVPPEKLDRVVAMAERQMAHMTRLLDDLLDVARLATGRVELRLERLDVAAIARDCAENAQRAMAMRFLDFEVDIAADPLWVHGDAVRVAQVIDNVLSNAAKYTQDGGRVEMQVGREGANAVIRVRDNGIGFRGHDAEGLFELFSREDGPVQRSAGGLGVGLSLVREFAQRHGGRVWARSEGPMKGSEFVIELPLERPAAAGSVLH